MKDWVKAFSIWFNVVVLREALVIIIETEHETKYRVVLPGHNCTYYTCSALRMIGVLETTTNVHKLMRSCFSYRDKSLWKNLLEMCKYDKYCHKFDKSLIVSDKFMLKHKERFTC